MTVHVYVGPEVAVGYHSLIILHFYFFFNSKFNLARWLASGLQGSTCFCPDLSVLWAVIWHHAQLFMWILGIQNEVLRIWYLMD